VRRQVARGVVCHLAHPLREAPAGSGSRIHTTSIGVPRSRALKPPRRRTIEARRSAPITSRAGSDCSPCAVSTRTPHTRPFSWRRSRGAARRRSRARWGTRVRDRRLLEEIAFEVALPLDQGQPRTRGARPHGHHRASESPVHPLGPLPRRG
jgi:hypothetical protein